MSLFKSLISINNSKSLNKNIYNNNNNSYIYNNQISKYDMNNISVFYEDDASESGDDFGNPKL